MEHYTALSLETHLFFARIMKEHALFLEAGFPCKDKEWIERADSLKERFEELLGDTVKISDGRVHSAVLLSEELTTPFTIPAEDRTQALSGVMINSDITRQTQKLQASCECCEDREIVRAVNSINRRALQLLDELILFKESILAEVSRGRLFQANYPLLIQHILREAKLYRTTVRNLLERRDVSYQSLRDTEMFWNQIMMEHALFIRGLLDPTEEELIRTADNFACDYQELLEKSKMSGQQGNQNDAGSFIRNKKIQQVQGSRSEGYSRLQDFIGDSAALADHVLREANHYIRLLESDSMN